MEYYEKFMNAATENELIAAGRNWLDLGLENPFKQDTPEHSLYFQAKYYHRRWRAQGVDSRSAYKKMISYLKQLKELNIENPYKEEKKKKENKPIKQAKTEPVKEEPVKTDPVKEEPAEEPTKEPVTKRVFGIIEEPKKWFRKAKR